MLKLLKIFLKVTLIFLAGLLIYAACDDKRKKNEAEAKVDMLIKEMVADTASIARLNTKRSLIAKYSPNDSLLKVQLTLMDSIICYQKRIASLYLEAEEASLDAE